MLWTRVAQTHLSLTLVVVVFFFLSLSFFDHQKGKFTGKADTAKLLHLAFQVAKDPSMQPAVIYIDDVDMMFSGGKKKDKDGPTR